MPEPSKAWEIQIDRRVSVLENTMTTIQADIVEIKHDMAVMRSDVTELKGEFREFRAEIRGDVKRIGDRLGWLISLLAGLVLVFGGLSVGGIVWLIRDVTDIRSTLRERSSAYEKRLDRLEEKLDTRAVTD